MKRTMILSLPSILSLLIAHPVMGQQPTPAKMSSTTQPSPTIKTMPHFEPPQSNAPIAPKPTVPAPVQLPVPIPQQAEYLHPGILVFFNGMWQGSDHLLNLTNNIGVSVSIVTPENEILSINEMQIQREIISIFSRVNIRPQTLAPQGKPPLPAFEIEIFVYPIERGYTACIAGRLFESVVLERFKMDPNMAFQAITWEKQNLIVAPKEQFSEQVIKTVQDIATTFAERFQAYENLKRRL
jgi:hypothetical protein